MIKNFFSAIALVLTLQASAFTTDTVKVATEYLDTPLDVVIITPDAATEDRTFPTVYLLNGFGGNHLSWTGTQPRLGELADSYGMVMVMPDGRDSWYWDSTLNPGLQMESAITKAVVPYVDEHYPTKAKASQRAITGLSMGGHGAMWLATRHPDIFGSMGSMSGGVDIRPFPGSWKMAERIGKYDTNKERWENSTVINLVPQMAANGQNITFDCGVDDFFAKVNRNLHQALLDAKVPHDYAERPGAHTHKYWGNSILYHLLFFNQAFKAAE